MDILQSLKHWQERRRRRRHLEDRFLEFWNQHGLRLVSALEQHFPIPEPMILCYYCLQYRPASQVETIGKYDYCIEHGRARQMRLLKEEPGAN